MIYSTTENFQAKNAKKFGSGNGANARKDSCFKSVFSEITDFKAKQTVLFSGRRNCAKITRSAARGLTRSGPECQDGRKIKGVPGGGEKPGFSPEIP
jgi:hypothetical protein